MSDTELPKLQEASSYADEEGFERLWGEVMDQKESSEGFNHKSFWVRVFTKYLQANSEEMEQALTEPILRKIRQQRMHDSVLKMHQKKEKFKMILRLTSVLQKINNNLAKLRSTQGIIDPKALPDTVHANTRKRLRNAMNAGDLVTQEMLDDYKKEEETPLDQFGAGKVGRASGQAAKMGSTQS